MGQEGLLTPSFFFSSEFFHKDLPWEGRGGNKHTWRAQYNGELYAAFGKDESLPKRNLLILPQLVWTVGAMIYFTGEVSGSSPGWPSCAREKNRRSI